MSQKLEALAAELPVAVVTEVVRDLAIYFQLATLAEEIHARRGRREQLAHEGAQWNYVNYGPANHLLRGIDRFLDLSELHQHLAPHYSSTGRPSIDPALLIPHAGCGVLLRYPLGAAALRGSASESGLPLVLPA